MKVTVSYNLPEENEMFEEHMKGSEYSARIHLALNYIRSQVKYTELTEHEMELLDAIRDVLEE